MRMIFGVVLLIGIALAGFAVHLTQNYVTQHKAALANAQAAKGPAIKTVPVFVANKRLRYGDKLTIKDVAIVKWPAGAVPEGVFLKQEDLFPKDETAPRFIMRTTEKYEAILAVKITEPGEEAGLNSRLERGQRAFTIKVDVSSGVSGFLRPGDHVDVYWTGRSQGIDGRKQTTVSKMIQPGVKIIAIDQSSNEETQGASIARTVTVSVAPEQVASLSLAQSTGKLALSLLGARDDTVAGAIELNQQTLLGIEEAVPEAKKEAAKVCTIKTRKGADVVSIPIPCTN